MSKASGDAPLGGTSREDIARLASSYDRFVHALDPFSEDSAAAEREFKRELAECFDTACIRNPELKQVGFVTFRREVIKRCRAYLKATDKPASP
jgi:hypothetical protein